MRLVDITEATTGEQISARSILIPSDARFRHDQPLQKSNLTRSNQYSLINGTPTNVMMIDEWKPPDHRPAPWFVTYAKWSMLMYSPILVAFDDTAQRNAHLPEDANHKIFI